MMRRASLLLFLGLATAPPTRGQADSVPRGTVVGTVLDAATGAPLHGAMVLLEMRDGLATPAGSGSPVWQAGRAVLTDADGVYRFERLAPGTYRLFVRRIGYEATTLNLDLAAAGTLRVSVGLRVQPVRLRAETVEAPRVPFARTASLRDDLGFVRRALERERQDRFLTTDARILTAGDLVAAVTLGETDLLRAFHRLPGIGTRDDYTAEIWTRGAPWSQTRVLFDGVPLFNPVHAAGVFSGIHPEAVGAVAFHPGVRSAAHGEGAAGLLDIASRRGGPGTHGVVDLSRVSLRTQLEGGGERTGWMIAARRSHIDATTGAFGDSADFVPYAFHDVVARGDVALGSLAALEVSGLWERDDVRGNVADYLIGNTGDWGNLAGRATLRVPVMGLLVRPTVGGSRFDAGIDAVGVVQTPEGQSAVTSRATRNEVTWTAARLELEPVAPRSFRWAAGGELVRQEQAYRGPYPRPYPVALLSETLLLDRRLDVAAAWLEGRVRAGIWSAQAGLRLDAPLQNPALPATVSPRLAVRAAPTPDVTLSAGWNRTVQYTQALAPAGPSIGPDLHLSDVWLLAGDTIPAVRADVVTAGVESWIGGAWLGQVNVFLRRARGVVVPDPRPGPVLTDRPVFVEGANTAEGIELGLRRMVGRWTASFAYTTGRSRLEALGLAFPARQDQRHAFDATALVRLGGSVRVGGALTAASGTPFTRVLLDLIPCEQLQSGCTADLDTLRDAGALEAPNAGRTPARVTADLFGEWDHQFGDVRVGIFAQVRNVLNRRNAVTYVGTRDQSCGVLGQARDGYVRTSAGAGPGQCDEFWEGLPLLPLFGVRVEF